MEPKILSKYSNYFDLLLNEVEIFTSFVQCFKSSNITSISINRYQVASIFYFYKSTNLLMSINILLSNGNTDSSKILIRSLIELSFNYEYLSKTKDNNIEKFWHHPSISIYFTFLNMLKNEKTSDFLKEDIKNLLPKYEENYQKYKNLYSLNKKKDVEFNERFNWSGMSISSLADLLERTDLYTQYYLFSNTTHTNATTIQDIIDIDKHEFDFADDEEEIPPLILFSCQLHNIVLELVNSCFNFLFLLKIHEFNDRINKLESNLES